MAATLTRGLSGIVRPLTGLGQSCFNLAVRAPLFLPRFSTLIQRHFGFKPLPSLNACGLQQQTLLQRVSPLVPSLMQQPCRNLTYYSVKKGKRKTVRSVVQRFLRLHCGLWVRRKAGYKKKLWKKSAVRKKRLREHVFCNKTQCKKLDKMTTSFWKRRNWYLNDPYQKYHDRVNL
ncbi:39S ribosomal protein L35, mitochondrial [Ictalurus punctatus]|uniref:Large ribosomal subunit protein bL35m n=1 Tax=Ictalurus punctatus TaxID=7998 RepID=E3TFF3_ICTPU|nr:39S ribosomal protein L35, mitochondrial [Ictalurus punctatus]XP_053488046.1 39S ribosomal protein L35, mitochondrial [Ictalurus furcatus]ADO29039.1 mitochondrial 39S ribosomal protein l35 [Ictalurus punctatus]